MFESNFLETLANAWLVLAGFTFLLLFVIPAPYGRHNRDGWGPNLSSLVGWVVMETPAALVFPAMLLLSPQRSEPTAWFFVFIWEIHYVHRSWIYPFLRVNKEKKMPAIIMLFGVMFNSCNGFLNGAFLFFVLPSRNIEWFFGPIFLAGATLFALGMALNIHSDRLLSGLGRDSSSGYQIPTGGGFRMVSSPNYLGEIIEWFGWALATWSLGSLCFAVWTAANLIPRAVTNHRWYQSQFPEYPKERKAILPFLI